MGFAPRLQPQNFRCFWSTGSGWGIFEQQAGEEKQMATIRVFYGSLDLEVLEIKWVASPQVPKKLSCHAKLCQRKVTSEVKVKERTIEVRFPSVVRMEFGEELRVVISSSIERFPG